MMAVYKSTGSSTKPGIDWASYAVAFASACLGSLLTIAGELIFRVRDDRTIFKDARKQLVIEIRTIFRQCKKYASATTSTFPTVVLDSPLPKSAWNTLILSGQLRRLKADQIEALNSFYRDVESVNARTALIPMLLQTVALSQQKEVRAAFTEEAQRVSTKPYAEMLTKRASLEKLLGEALG